MLLNEIKEKLPTVKTPSPKEIAEKHGVSLDKIQKALKVGVDHEKEHSEKLSIAREIALDHLAEDPDYYEKLKGIDEAIKPPVFATKPKVQKLVNKLGIPSQEVLTALRGKKKKKCNDEYKVVKKAKV